MKIKTLALNNFRGFPGPGEAFDFDDKNLLIYGENGSGKSSIFHALRAFFSWSISTLPMALDPEKGRNQFSGLADCSITVEFDDNRPPLVWNHDYSNLGSIRSDSRLLEAAEMASFLDYKSLLRTNFSHGTDTVNLFEVIVGSILADYQVPTAGGTTTTLLKLYADAEWAIPRGQSIDVAEIASEYAGAYLPKYTHSNAVLDEIERARLEFNKRLKGALSDLKPVVNTILSTLLGQSEGVSANPDLELLDLEFDDLVYDRKNKRFTGAAIRPILRATKYEPPRPQSFLNEARLSALALALYFAGRLHVVPSNATYINNKLPVPLKIMVLDDVLIGLDMSNRSTVLQVLRDVFAEWQIVLLTHDRTWFEMARLHCKPMDTWKSIELYEGKREKVDADNNVVVDGHGTPILIPAPIVHRGSSSNMNLPKSLLNTAGKFLDQGFLPAAASYTRAAYEASLKSVCHEFDIPVRYNVDPKKVKVIEFHKAVVNWLGTKSNEKRRDLTEAMVGVEMYQSIVLNPLSHSLPWNLTKYEVTSAIQAVERLLQLRSAEDDVNPERLRQVRDVIALAAPSTDQLKQGLLKLRSAFHSRLDLYCEGKILVPYTLKTPNVNDLWGGLLSHNPAAPQGVAALLANNADKQLVEAWLVRGPQFANLNKQILVTLHDIICPTGGEKMIFDG